jgi:hypothetical protein
MRSTYMNTNADESAFFATRSPDDATMFFMNDLSYDDILWTYTDNSRDQAYWLVQQYGVTRFIDDLIDDTGLDMGEKLVIAAFMWGKTATVGRRD